MSRSIQDRFWFTAVSLMLSKLSKKRSQLMVETEFHLVKRLYERAGGSWVNLSEGNSDSWTDLRRCAKAYLKVCKEKKLGPYSPDREGDL